MKTGRASGSQPAVIPEQSSKSLAERLADEDALNKALQAARAGHRAWDSLKIDVRICTQQAKSSEMVAQKLLDQFDEARLNLSVIIFQKPKTNFVPA